MALELGDVFLRVGSELFDARLAAEFHLLPLVHEGDRITHRTIRSLNQTFLTPIDAEDIHALTTALDNVMDAIEAAASRMVLFRIEQPTAEAKELCETIVTSTEPTDMFSPLYIKPGADALSHARHRWRRRDVQRHRIQGQPCHAP